jgi:hypothetical protein
MRSSLKPMGGSMSADRIDKRGKPTPVADSTDGAKISPFSFSQSAGEESIPGLVRQLADQGRHLAQQQLDLFRAEMRASVTDLKQAAGAMVGAAVVGLAGFVVVLMGLAYLLNEVMKLWAATLIVGVATLAIAYFLYRAGAKKLQSGSVTVDRTRSTLERAPGAISGGGNEGYSE